MAPHSSQQRPARGSRWRRLAGVGVLALLAVPAAPVAVVPHRALSHAGRLSGRSRARTTMAQTEPSALTLAASAAAAATTARPRAARASAPMRPVAPAPLAPPALPPAAHDWLAPARARGGAALVGLSLLGAQLLAPAAILGGGGGAAWAENELAAQCRGKFDSSLIDRQCFVSACKTQTTACLENSDCMKGLVCTARCLGDTKCISGCFARFGNADIDGLIKCSIEDNACIKVSILPPGPDAPSDVPPPPLPVVSPFESRSLEGRWYKVMGWNSMYDCYDCQVNKFTALNTRQQGPQPAQSPTTLTAGAAASDAGADAGSGRADGAAVAMARAQPSTLQVDVDFDMPRPAKLLRSGHNHQHLRETLELDPPGSTRTAHTHGTMFGLSFWENWFLIGESAPGQPQFKIIYYNGRTIQNKYDGAFVYARTPEVPQEALPAIYSIAERAGLDPSGFCKVRNSCGVPTQLGPELIGVPGVLADTPQPSVASALRRAEGRRSGEAVGRAELLAPSLPSNPLVLSSLQLWYELTDYLEDPHYAGSYILSQQERMPPRTQLGGHTRGVSRDTAGDVGERGGDGSGSATQAARDEEATPTAAMLAGWKTPRAKDGSH